MKNFYNKLGRELEWTEMEALIECGKILSKAFGKKVFSIGVNPHTSDPSQVYGVQFAFSHSEYEDHYNNH